MQVSDQGLAFIARHEGFVSTAYRDPVGLLTIGYGFTMRSRVFRDWWQTKFGRPLQIGDTLSREEANKLLLKLVDEEYATPVRKLLPGLDQARFDAAVSAVYNLGAGALNWRWAKALLAGDFSRAAALLARTGVTAGGKRLAGLVRRRREESALLLTGRHDSQTTPTDTFHDAEIERIQRQLATLGFFSGTVNGRMTLSLRQSISTFQKANPPLVVDGIAGPATQARMQSLLSCRAGNYSTLGGGLLSALTGMATGIGWQELLLLVLGVAVLVALVCLTWRYRGALSLMAGSIGQALGHVFPSGGPSAMPKAPPTGAGT